MELLSALYPSLPEGRVLRVEVGLFWTAVLIKVNGRLSCGLAATQHNPEQEHGSHSAVKDAGKLEDYSAQELAALVSSESSTEVSIGLATINALLPRPQSCVELPAEDYIARQGDASRVAVIGHFPFVKDLREKVRELWVLELKPGNGDLPASAGPEIIPQADILAITSTTLINHTFDEVFRYRKPGAKVLLLGPSTPLAPQLFDMGIHVLSGTLVEDADAVLALVRQGASFRQIKSHGVRLVTLEAQA